MQVEEQTWEAWSTELEFSVVCPEKWLYTQVWCLGRGEEGTGQVEMREPEAQLGQMRCWVAAPAPSTGA